MELLYRIVDALAEQRMNTLLIHVTACGDLALMWDEERFRWSFYIVLWTPWQSNG